MQILMTYLKHHSNAVLLVSSALLLLTLVWFQRSRLQRKRRLLRARHEEVSMGEWEADDGIIAVRTVVPAEKLGPPKLLLAVYCKAEADRPYAGYELLQAILSLGLRFGDMQIFHKYVQATGKGPILFSVASAQDEGLFDIQKMGVTKTQGLCFVMRVFDENQNVAALDAMLEAANQLIQDLGGELLADDKTPFTRASYERYRRQLHSVHESSHMTGELA